MLLYASDYTRIYLTSTTKDRSDYLHSTLVACFPARACLNLKENMRISTLFRIPSIVLFLLFATTLTACLPSSVLANHCNKDTEQELSIAITDPNTGATVHCVPKNSTDIQTNPILLFLRAVLQFLAFGIGLAIVGGLVVGGIMYTTARANAQQVQKAEATIRNALIGLALFIFTFAIINFLVPGGILF